jgi:N-hydroxyarylamine O-acetyltransferase
MKANLVKQYLDALEINTHKGYRNHDIKTLDDISQLVQRHLATFNFTSIKVLLHNELSLENDFLIQKIVVEKQGGYCFEHNKLMFEVLQYLGFEVTALFGRVLLNRDINVPQTHRITLLKYNDDFYIVDVGFGALSPSLPIKFGKVSTTTSQNTEYLITDYKDNKLALQIVKDKAYFTLYSFDLQRYHDNDFEMGHFYSHQHPKANFVNNFVISKIYHDKVHSIVNNRYQIIQKSKTEVIMIKNEAQLEMILKEVFDYPIVHSDICFIFNKFLGIDNKNHN